jgi:hypothetical protein
MEDQHNHTVPGLENLRIIDDEEEDLEIDINDDDTREKHRSYNLVGRFLTNRPIRVNMMMNNWEIYGSQGKG